MKKVIITSNKYSFCLEGYQKLANKYWGEDETFTVLAFEQPQAKLAKNYSLNILGPGFNDTTPWDVALLPYFSNISDDFFFLCFEDHFLISHVKTKLMNKAAKIMKENNDISKIRLLPCYKNNVVKKQYDSNFDLLDIQEGYNRLSFASLRPSIWRTSTFVEMLSVLSTADEPQRTPHLFETVNYACSMIKGNMLIPRGTSPLYPDLDAFRQGRIHPNALSSGPVSGWWGEGNDSIILSEEDKDVFRATRDVWHAQGGR